MKKNIFMFIALFSVMITFQYSKLLAISIAIVYISGVAIVEYKTMENNKSDINK